MNTPRCTAIVGTVSPRQDYENNQPAMDADIECGAELVRAEDGPCTRGMGATGAWGMCGARPETPIHNVLVQYGGHDYLGPLVCSVDPTHISESANA